MRGLASDQKHRGSRGGFATASLSLSTLFHINPPSGLTVVETPDAHGTNRDETACDPLSMHHI